MMTTSITENGNMDVEKTQLVTNEPPEMSGLCHPWTSTPNTVGCRLNFYVFGKINPTYVAPLHIIETAIPCDECSNAPSVFICPECQWEGEGWLCKSCGENHECGDENYFQPVVNSPRACVCGYNG